MDYWANSNEITFATNDTRQCVNISITDDEVTELRESFTVSLLPASDNMTILLDPLASSSTVYINDDDGKFAFQ